MLYPKRGADLAREMKWLGSYRYGVFNLGAASLEGLFSRFQRLYSEIDFHPASHRAPDVAHAAAAGPRRRLARRSKPARRRRPGG